MLLAMGKTKSFIEPQGSRFKVDGEGERDGWMGGFKEWVDR